MFCPNCGAQIDDKAVVCVNCGCSVNKAQQEDSYSIGLNILSFFIPIVGIILFAVYHGTQPKKSKGCLIAAIVSIGISVLFTILVSVIFANLVTDAMYTSYYYL